jgi:uncharacterized delta-60 repeat protein
MLCFVTQVNSQLAWLNLYNGPSGGDDGSNAVTIDASGNTYITGFTTGASGMRDITTLKYNSKGGLVWSRTYNGSANGQDEAYAITIDASGNVYVAGYSTRLITDRDMILIKYSNSGLQQWVRTYNGPGSSSDVAYAITVDRSGNPIITGYSYDLLLGLQMTTIKYSPYGVILWIDTYNAEIGGGEDVAYAITVDSGNNIYIAGYSTLSIVDAPTGKDMVTVKISETGTREWVNTYDASSMDDEAYSIAVDMMDNVFITGYSTSGTGKDFTTVKYDKTGQQKWLNRYNNESANSDDVPAKLMMDTDGNIIVTGSSRSSSSHDKNDYLTVKYKNINGSMDFVSRYNDASDNSDNAYSVTGNNGRIYVAGSSQSTPFEGSEDIVIIEYSKLGMILSKYRVINPGKDIPAGIILDKQGNITLAGSLRGTISEDMAAGRFNPELFDGNVNEFVTLKVTHTYDMSKLTNTNTEIPGSFNLYQNYPNPFNPYTTIKFDVSVSSLVKISVFDALGREISVPVNDYLNAGTYEISVNMMTLTSGVYFYKMTSGGFSDIRKMMLIK